MDNLLIEFWRQHDCLFNSSIESYYDKHLKTKLWSQFAQSIGKPVSDVERRSRSLRTQYGRLLWRPDRIKTFQQTMLKEKLDFLRPYIIRRRGGEEEDNFNFNDDDDEGEETEGSIDQETGSMFGSLLGADVSGHDPIYEARSQDSTPSVTPQLLCPPSQPQLTEAVINMASSGNTHQSDDNIAVHPPREERATEEAVAAPRQHHDVLNQFSEVMLSDMRQIRDPLVLMRLRRDITDLVFKAADEDALLKRRGGRASLVSHAATATSGESGHQFRGYTRAQDAAVCLQNYKMSASPSRRQRFLERRNRGIGRRIQKWEMMRRVATRGQRPHPPPGGGGFQGQGDHHHHHHHEQERLGDASSQPASQALETKPEFEPQMIKIEEEMLPLV